MSHHKKQILFVDDEPNVLQGLRRMLRSMRREWEMSFVESADEALRLLEKNPFDVIVSDMRMPGVDGAQLLNEVRMRYPQVVRIILSGHSDPALIFKSVATAHQYLGKPSQPEVLKYTIKRACALRELLAEDTLKQAISRMGSLPSLPLLYEQCMEELQSPTASLQKIGRIVSRDVGMSAKVLQLINSAFFGLRGNVSSPIHAVSLLGLDTIKALVLSMPLFSRFEQEGLPLRFAEQLWNHSLRSAVYAKKIAVAEKQPHNTVEDAFMAGLLHDAGKLVLAANLVDPYRETLNAVKKGKGRLWEAEKTRFGTSHAEVGAYLMGLWGLPDAIVEALAYHHRPGDCPGGGFSVLTAVYAANALAHEAVDGEADGSGHMIDLVYLSKLDLDRRLSIWRDHCTGALWENAGNDR
jgi:HD-like signal output (HDOD) protein/CheY-like chemotaxis protein